MNTVELLMAMIFAHLLADWTLQTPIQAQHKATNLYIMFVHCFVWTFCLFIPLMLTGYHINYYIFSMTFFLHWFVDDLKCWLVWKKFDEYGKLTEWNDKNFETWHLYLDQGIHIVQIIGLWAFYIYYT